MEGFIKVNATPCTSQGATNPQEPAREIELNLDLVGVIDGNSILLKSGDNILSLGGKYYTNLMIVDRRQTIT